MPCRFDWHQTGAQVIISIYAKNAVPELSYVDANSTTVREARRPSTSRLPSFRRVLLNLTSVSVFPPQVNIHVIFDGEKEFEQKISLWGVSTASTVI